TGLEVLGKTGHPHAAIGFAEQVFRGGPALMFRDPAPDEVTDGFNVLVQSVEIVGFRFSGGAAVAGGHGIDENDIAEIQDAEWVFDDARGWQWWLRAIARKLHASRADAAEM